MSSTIICSAMSKNTILPLAFCDISLIALLARSLICRMLFSLTNLANFDVNASSSAVIYVSSGCWKLYMKLSLVSRRKKVRNLFCFSLPYELMSSLQCYSSLTLRWYARRMSDWKSARNSLFSPSADSSPTAVSQSPLASRASRIA